MRRRRCPRRPTSVPSWGTPARWDRSPAAISLGGRRDPLQRQQPAPDHEPGDQRAARPSRARPTSTRVRISARSAASMPGHRRRDRQDRVRPRRPAPSGRGTAATRRRTAAAGSSRARPAGSRPGRRAGPGRGSGSLGKARTGMRRITLPCAVEAHHREPPPGLAAGRSGRRAAGPGSAPSATASSSRSTRSTRLARVSPTTQDARRHERDRQQDRERASRQPAAAGSIARGHAVATSSRVRRRRRRAGRSRSRGPSAAGAARRRRACAAGS